MSPTTSVTKSATDTQQDCPEFDCRRAPRAKGLYLSHGSGLVHGGSMGEEGEAQISSRRIWR